MISDKYEKQLIAESKELDHLLGNSSEFEKLVTEIIVDKNKQSCLEMIKNLGQVAKQNPSSNVNKKQEKICECIFLYLGSSEVQEMFGTLQEVSHLSLEALLRQLDDLVGLMEVKQRVRNLISFNQIQQLREKKGLKKSHKTLHMAFLGNPGTGKTTVARIVGRMYKTIGLLSKGHFIEATRTDLIAEYQGQTAIKVKKLVNKARGGVLFIDEAYSITENDHSDSYGKECLTELTKALEDYRDDLVVIVAGYTDLMEQFFDSNPGLKSRFNTFVTFDDYTIDELVGIFLLDCKANDYIVDESVRSKVKDYLQKELDKKENNFSNGRSVRNLFDDVVMKQSIRLSKEKSEISREMLQTFIMDDVPENWETDQEVSE